MGKERWGGGGGSYSPDICRAKEVLAQNRHQKIAVPLYIPYSLYGCTYDEGPYSSVMVTQIFRIICTYSSNLTGRD